MATFLVHFLYCRSLSTAYVAPQDFDGIFRFLSQIHLNKAFKTLASSGSKLSKYCNVILLERLHARLILKQNLPKCIVFKVTMLVFVFIILPAILLILMLSRFKPRFVRMTCDVFPQNHETIPRSRDGRVSCDAAFSA